MIVDFALRSSVFVEPTDLAEAVPVHRMLLKAWRNAGRLCIFDLNALVELISKLPGEIRKLWFEALKDSSFPKLVHNYDPDSCGSRADLESQDRKLDLLAITGNEGANFFSRTGAFAEVFSNGVEVARVEFISESTRFRSAFEELTGRLSKGIDRSTLISDHLARRIVNVEHFVVVDRYFLSNFSNSGALKTSGAQGLAEVVNSMGKLKSVKIYSSEKGVTWQEGQMESPVKTFLTALKNEISNSIERCPSLELIINKDHRYSEGVHDRYFRFDRITFDVGTGAEFLARPNLRRSTNYTIGFKGQDYRSAYEHRLNSTKICSVTT